MKLPFIKQHKRLINPRKERKVTHQEITTSSEPVPEKEEISEAQIQLDIKDSKLEPIYKIKRVVTRLEKKAEVMPFWRSGITIIALVVSTFSIVIITFVIYYFFPRLPISLPLFYNQTTDHWNLYDKSLYLGFPLVYTGLLIMTWRIIYMVFPFDRRLASVSTWTLLIFSIFGVIGISQLISLLLL
ncbi:hypothetical protein JW796_03030 [Candidatus Dojkabacteria bacterium]|nr:hypothetical protein [Candidatus Dojkabacteria bacterium]